MGDEFTHLTESGVHMVEVGEKPDQKRKLIFRKNRLLFKSEIGDVSLIRHFKRGFSKVNSHKPSNYPEFLRICCIPSFK